MDPATLIISVGSAAVAGLVAVVVGRRRGIDQIETRNDAALQSLVEVQAARLALMELERADMRSRISALEAEVVRLRTDLEMERRITARFRVQEADGK